MNQKNMMPPYYHSQPTEYLEAMYPDIYYCCYPVVKNCCEMYDVPSNPMCYPYPTRAAVEQMTDYCTRIVASDPAFSGDPMVTIDGGRFLRTLIAILLIRELLRRRGIYTY
ncbi:hypothetical protein [Desulfotomaculum nigrificans]|uniref:hypothetical protein n=1 Tax=Desulfotomaculum nigrificans TaxID=1565 RepID=UPI0001FAEB1F|nr:hypothetical protein [Desulfotomaculum nigrificans]